MTACAAAIGAAWLLPAPHAHARGGKARLDRAERALVAAINRLRSQHGLPGLRSNPRLARSADFHCRDMLRADFFAHDSSDGTPYMKRVRRFRPSNRIGETLAYLPRNQRSGATSRILRLWISSPSHRRLLLSRTFRRVGVARRQGTIGNNRVVVYTADFASAH